MYFAYVLSMCIDDESTSIDGPNVVLARGHCM